MAVTLIDSITRFRRDQLTRIRDTAQFLLSLNDVSSHNVNIVLTNDQEISRFNKRYRNLSRPDQCTQFSF